MNRSRLTKRHGGRSGHVGRVLTAMATVGLGLGGLTGCDDATKQQMGEVFFSSLEEGLTTILSGAVAGVFAGVSDRLGTGSGDSTTPSD
ncbi:MAG: hypothetical protein IPM18_16615 [Phycisphaerales bacterium]|nr:hypothetical protein [Phycisphaerales bacterium]